MNKTQRAFGSYLWWCWAIRKGRSNKPKKTEEKNVNTKSHLLRRFLSRWCRVAENSFMQNRTKVSAFACVLTEWAKPQPLNIPLHIMCYYYYYGLCSAVALLHFSHSLSSSVSSHQRQNENAARFRAVARHETAFLVLQSSLNGRVPTYYNTTHRILTPRAMHRLLLLLERAKDWLADSEWMGAKMSWHQVVSK